MFHGRLLGCLLVPLISGCSLFSKGDPAPVVDPLQSAISHGIHRVKAGETLYEIAWQYGLDYHDLAAANHIAPPYVIYPNQKLSLKKSKKTRKSNSSPPKKAQKITSNQKIQTPPPQFSQSKWIWPVKGKILKPYMAKGLHINKGIDIAGTLGQPIYAAAAGNVVYSGIGLRGYGQLIIIKHNELYLSAYAHNRRLLVKEGDSVSQGQIIAEMGQSESDRVKLHFEIRKKGLPINPQSLLPSLAA